MRAERTRVWRLTWAMRDAAFPRAASIATPPGRLAHDLFARNGLVYSVGGFNNAPLADFMVLQHDRCAWYTRNVSCLSDPLCTWTKIGCTESLSAPSSVYPQVTTANVIGLPTIPDANCSICDVLTTQTECDANYDAHGCLFCPATGTCLTLAANQTASSPDVAYCQRSASCIAGTLPALVPDGTHAWRAASPCRSAGHV